MKRETLLSPPTAITPSMPQALLTIHNLQLGFAHMSQPAQSLTKELVHPILHGVNLSVEEGKVTALVGSSGSGKSLTARAVMGLLPPTARLTGGTINFMGHNLSKAIQKTPCKESERLFCALRGHAMGMVFQDPLSSLNPLHTLEKQVQEPLIIHQKLCRRALHDRVAELFSMVGLEYNKHFLARYPHQISGGQRQRVALAMALANEPKLLIADEPTTALDAEIQRQILSLISDLRHSLQMGVLIISHDLEVVQSLADTIHVMESGYIVESAPTKAIFTAPQAMATRALLGAEGPTSPVPMVADAPVIVEGHKISVNFERRNFWGKIVHSHTVLDSVDFYLKKGECLGIVGESGSGKSTMALAILRLIKYGGTVSFNGQDCKNISVHEDKELRRCIQVVFQDPFASLNPRMTIFENIAEGLIAHFPQKKAVDYTEIIGSALGEVGLSPTIFDAYPNELSGGQCQRVVIARALVLKPKVLILDEPTSSLDRVLQFQILALLAQLQEKYGLACIFITHDLTLVARFCHRVITLHKGQIHNQSVHLKAV